MTLVRKQHELARIDTIEPWLRTVAVNIARDAGRRVTAAGKIDPLRIAQQHESQPHATADEDDTISRAQAAMKIVESLPMIYGEPLLLSLRGLSYRQISAVMDLPESTIQNRLFRARTMVRDELQRRDQPALRLADATRSTHHG